MIKHKTFRNKTLNVSTAFYSDGKIEIDENGIVITELTDEGKSKLLNVDGFINAEPIAPPPNLTKIPSLDEVKKAGYSEEAAKSIIEQEKQKVEAPADSSFAPPPDISDVKEDPDKNDLP